MRTTKGALIFLLLAVMILTTRQSALGQSEVNTPESPITVNEKAHGTKVSGTLTIQYELTDSCPIGVATQFFFMRLKKGKNLFPFSGDLSGQDICLDNTPGQQAAIEEFIKDQVIPDLFSCSQPSCPPFALRSVDRIVLGFTEPPLFVMMDFVIAVQEKRGEQESH